ncbi:hypothetical protein VP01_387g5 [Puccinia sorghi]|uniref:Uncharacterized protein n=1 Tax=Puccinia sorghi TaxID=27349 RepID=A0A0L6UUU4_9BASI|nr:hypothetical protein VP01_387g5 [Puccinia sorghi]
MTSHSKKNAQVPVVDMQKVPGSFCVTATILPSLFKQSLVQSHFKDCTVAVPKHVHMQTCGLSKSFCKKIKKNKKNVYVDFFLILSLTWFFLAHTAILLHVSVVDTSAMLKFSTIADTFAMLQARVADTSAFLKLTCSMLQPSCHPNSTCLHVYLFWHIHCAVCTVTLHQPLLSNFFFFFCSGYNIAKQKSSLFVFFFEDLVALVVKDCSGPLFSSPTQSLLTTILPLGQLSDESSALFWLVPIPQFCLLALLPTKVIDSTHFSQLMISSFYYADKSQHRSLTNIIIRLTLHILYHKMSQKRNNITQTCERSKETNSKNIKKCQKGRKGLRVRCSLATQLYKFSLCIDSIEVVWDHVSPQSVRTFYRDHWYYMVRHMLWLFSTFTYQIIHKEINSYLLNACSHHLPDIHQNLSEKIIKTHRTKENMMAALIKGNQILQNKIFASSTAKSIKSLQGTDKSYIAHLIATPQEPKKMTNYYQQYYMAKENKITIPKGKKTGIQLNNHTADPFTITQMSKAQLENHPKLHCPVDKLQFQEFLLHYIFSHSHRLITHQFKIMASPLIYQIPDIITMLHMPKPHQGHHGKIQCQVGNLPCQEYQLQFIFKFHLNNLTAECITILHITIHPPANYTKIQCQGAKNQWQGYHLQFIFRHINWKITHQVIMKDEPNPTIPNFYARRAKFQAKSTSTKKQFSVTAPTT